MADGEKARAAAPDRRGLRVGAELPPAPVLRDHRLTAITVAEVDRFKTAKLREKKLGPAQVNKVLKLLAQIMDIAIEYECSDRPTRHEAADAASRHKDPRTWVEPEQLMALLDGADTYLRPVLATLAGAG